MTEPINLENTPVYPEFYPAVKHVMSAITAAPFIRDLMYFKLKTLQNETNNEIIDVP